MTSPSAAVVAAFGLPWVEPELLPGGQSRTWRVGGAVVKPVDDVEEHAWVCDVLDGWQPHPGVRVPRPMRSADGRWSWDGWSAHAYVEGAPATIATDAPLVRRAADAFHARLSGVPEPSFLEHRNDDWSFGDRVAWEGVPPVGSDETVALVEQGLAAYRPVTAPSQVVHGDLAGNVLVAPGLAPAVIDWPPYWRPPGWALAVAAVDGICWYDAPVGLLDDWSDVAADGPEWGQLLLRAIVYRAATVGRREVEGMSAMSPREHGAAVAPVLRAVLTRL